MFEFVFQCRRIQIHTNQNLGSYMHMHVYVKHGCYKYEVANSSSQNFGITIIILRISYLYNLNRLDFKNYDGALLIIHIDILYAYLYYLD